MKSTLCKEDEYEVITWSLQQYSRTTEEPEPIGGTDGHATGRHIGKGDLSPFQSKAGKLNRIDGIKDPMIHGDAYASKLDKNAGSWEKGEPNCLCCKLFSKNEFALVNQDLVKYPAQLQLALMDIYAENYFKRHRWPISRKYILGIPNNKMTSSSSSVIGIVNENNR